MDGDGCKDKALQILNEIIERAEACKGARGWGEMVSKGKRTGRAHGGMTVGIFAGFNFSHCADLDGDEKEVT